MHPTHAALLVAITIAGCSGAPREQPAGTAMGARASDAPGATSGAAPNADPSAATGAERTAAPMHVHRAAFRDRAAMVLIDGGNGAWCAFNPRTAAIDMVWRGDVDWRGKVFDFSQETSRERGEVLRTRMAPLATAPDVVLQPGETARMRSASSARLPLQASIFVAFEEQDRTPVTVRVLENDGSERLRFQSCTSVVSDTEWQWNFKQFKGPSSPAAVEWTASGARPKSLRKMRIEAEEVAWMDHGKPLAVLWQGYDLAPDAVTLRFRLTDEQGHSADVTQRVEPVGALGAPGSGLRVTTTGIDDALQWHGWGVETKGSELIDAPEPMGEKR